LRVLIQLLSLELKLIELGLERLADGVPLNLPLYDYDDHDTFFSKSVVTKASKPLYLPPLLPSGVG